ncbi:MAG: response regulator transcription factor [Solirubrobacterales bacterium]|nr:response regulator transcription factor [Solirubrobacterales bacterium]
MILEAGDLRFDPVARIASRGDVELDLSTLELALLETFMRHRGQVLDSLADPATGPLPPLARRTTAGVSNTSSAWEATEGVTPQSDATSGGRTRPLLLASGRVGG